MTKTIAQRLIPVFKADVKMYRRQASEADKKLETTHATKWHSRYMRKLLLYSTCKCLLIECYNTE